MRNAHIENDDNNYLRIELNEKQNNHQCVCVCVEKKVGKAIKTHFCRWLKIIIFFSVDIHICTRT